MVNLAGDENADIVIREELYLANIDMFDVNKNSGEVPVYHHGAHR